MPDKGLNIVFKHDSLKAGHSNVFLINFDCKNALTRNIWNINLDVHLIVIPQTLLSFSPPFPQTAMNGPPMPSIERCNA